MILQALALTLRLAVLVSLILMAIGLPLGYWLAMSRWRGKFVVEALVATLLATAKVENAPGSSILAGASRPPGSWKT